MVVLLYNSTVFGQINPASCAIDPCNYITNGGFESSICGPIHEPNPLVSTTPCWDGVVGSPDFFKVGCLPEYMLPISSIACGPLGIETWDNLNNPANQSIVYLGGFHVTTPPAVDLEESIQTKLTTSLIPGNSYTFKCKVLRGNNGFCTIPPFTTALPVATSPADFQVAVSNAYFPRYAVGAFSNAYVTPFPYSNIITQPIYILNTWIPINQTFIYYGSLNADYLLINNRTTAVTYPQPPDYTVPMFFDDIEIIAATGNTFTPPATTCSILPNLAQYLNTGTNTITQLVFTCDGGSTGIVPTGTQFDFNPNLVALGYHIITATFITASGCPESISQLIRVTNHLSITPNQNCNATSILIDYTSINTVSSFTLTTNQFTPPSTNTTTTSVYASMPQTIALVANNTYTFTVVDANGCSASTILVPSLNPTVTITANNAGCPSVASPAILTATTNATYVSWLPSGSISNPINITAIGTYTVIATNSLGCTASATYLLSAIPFTASIEGSNCLTTSNSGISQLGNSTSTNSPFVFNWAGPNGAVLDPSSNPLPLTNQLLGVIGFNNANVGIYTFTVSDAGGCSASATHQVSMPPFNLVAASNSPILCGNPVNLTGSANVCCFPLYPINTITWSAPSGISFVNSNPCLNSANTNIVNCNNVANNVSNSSIFTMTVTDALGCIATKTTTVVINPLPGSLSAEFYHDYHNCQDFYTIKPSGLPLGTIYTIQPTGLTSNAIGNIYLNPPIAAGIYTITGATSNGCPISTTITLTNLPITAPFCACTPEWLLGTSQFLSPNSTSQDLINKVNNFNAIQPMGNYTIPVLGNNIGGGAPLLTLMIQGPFLLNTDLSLYHCEIIMVPQMVGGINQTEIITNGFNLDLELCNIYACDQMWKGITSSDPLRTITIENCSIKDMKYGANVSNGATLNVTNSTFTDNNIGLSFFNTPWNYNNIMDGNTFNSTGNLLKPPYNTQSKSEIGVIINNCSEVNVGDAASAIGNTFVDIYNGIKIMGRNSNKANVSVGRIKIYNNHFENIVDDNAYTSLGIVNKIATTYNSHRGVGVFASIKTSFFNQGLASTIIELHSTIGTSTFDECDKAMVTNGFSVNATNNVVANNLMGFMNTRGLYKWYNFNSNSITNCLQGISQDDDANNTKIGSNVISLANTNWTNPSTLQLIYPWGINVRNYNNCHTNALAIFDNNIDIKPDHGFGIILNSHAPNTYISTNIIGFSATTSPTNGWLHGIFSANCMGGQYSYNVVNSNAFVLNNQASIGYRFITSTHVNLNCNHANNTVTGMMVDGDCQTDKYAVAGNSFTNHATGLWFRTFGSVGTFLNIGDASNDNNNKWLGAYGANGNGQANKVYRSISNADCSAYPNNDKIYTNINTLNPFESDATDINCMYFVQTTNSPTIECPTFPIEPIDDEIEKTGVINPVLASEVANESIVYNTYPEISEWLAQKRLFRDLQDDEVAMLANTNLASFYNNKVYENMGKIERLNTVLALLADSIIIADSVVYDSLKNNAVILNNAINGGNIAEANEKWINELYNQVFNSGQENLTAIQITELSTLANNCPLLAGSAVYKARAIYSYYNSNITYDDKKICNAVGLYKKDNGEPNEDSLMNAMITTKKIIPMPKNNTVILYPNPTSSDLTISYNFSEKEDAEFIVYDVLGRHIETIYLPKTANKVTIKVEDWAKGIYMYKLIQKGAIFDNGKFSKE
jgi:Secretion system C-terminal sorting domain